MKNKKALELLDQQKHTTRFPSYEDQSAFDSFSSSLRDVVCENLELRGWAFDAKRSWHFDDHSQTFYFTVDFTISVEIEHEIEKERTKQASAAFHFSIDPLCADIATCILVLNQDLWRVSKGLSMMRSTQLAKILQTEGEEAFWAAQKRTH